MNSNGFRLFSNGEATANKTKGEKSVYVRVVCARACRCAYVLGQFYRVCVRVFVRCVCVTLYVCVCAHVLAFIVCVCACVCV